MCVDRYEAQVQAAEAEMHAAGGGIGSVLSARKIGAVAGGAAGAIGGGGPAANASVGMGADSMYTNAFHPYFIFPRTAMFTTASLESSM